MFLEGGYIVIPEYRQNEYLFDIPPFEIENSNVEEFVDELRKIHEKYADCFARSEPRERFFEYMVGQLSHPELKSIEPIAVSVSGVKSVRSMQKAISDAVWHEDKIISKHQEMVSDLMGNQDGVLTFDESGFTKKGDHSAGAARQYNGEIGKADNCQNGVFMGYATPDGYTLSDKRLYVPEKQFEEDYKEKREKCKFPEDLTFKTKPELAAEMYLDLINRNALPFKYIVADSIYGNSQAFIDAIESVVGKTYMVSMPSDTLFWLRSPVTADHEYKYKGEVRSERVLAENEIPPMTFAEFAKKLHKNYWYKRTVSEGTKGPIEYEFTKRNITLAKNGLPDRNVWQIIKRTVAENPEYYYYVSNAPVSTRLNTFVWLSGIRWSVEQCFQECKGQLGMGKYEVRKYTGWNRHMLTCIIAHFFCGILRSQ